jgi:16S rRNA (guanine966-N2)-methyltransferase
VTRIIGGVAGGRRLLTPAGAATRPTSDRTREALFSALESMLGSWQGVTLLDLYAGSGAVGLEALSRGAAAATCVEQDRRAAGVIRRNAEALELPLRLEPRSVASFLSGVPTAHHVAFLDPPYDAPDETLRRDLQALGRGWLRPGAVVVVERSSRHPLTGWPTGLEGLRERRYGETVLAYARFGSVAA